jgi:hypothetical protein
VGVANVMVPKFSQCQKFHCKYHTKEDRYSIAFFPDHKLVVVKCIECHPPMEIVRFKVAHEDAPKGENHRLVMPKSYKVKPS